MDEVFLGGRRRIKRSDARGFLTFLDRKVFTQAAGNGELPIHHRESSAQKEQIPGIGRLDVSPQRCWGRGQHDSELAKARTRTAGDSFITTYVGGHDEYSFQLPAAEMSAAIDVQDVTCDRRGLGQEHDRVRDLLDPRS